MTPATRALATPLPAVNIYTRPAFLDAVSAAYFPERRCHAQDHVVDGQVFRLLEVEGLGPRTTQTFIDMHEPLGPAAGPRGLLPRLVRLPGVGRAPLPLQTFLQQNPGTDALGAPSVVWRDHATWEDYLQVLRERHVLGEDLRRGRSLQRKLGTLSFQADDRAADVLPTCYAWKSARDLKLGRSDLFAVEGNRRFFPELRSRDLLRASTLRAGDRLLAIWLGALHARRWSGWVFAFNPDPELKRYSLGRRLLYAMLEESQRAGHAEFDFSIGMEPYKLDFATHVRPIGMAGRPPAGERAAASVKRLLRHSPWCYGKARAVRHWLARPPSQDNTAAP